MTKLHDPVTNIEGLVSEITRIKNDNRALKNKMKRIQDELQRTSKAFRMAVDALMDGSSLQKLDMISEDIETIKGFIQSELPGRINRLNGHLARQLESREILQHRLKWEPGTLPPTRRWAASPDVLCVLEEEVRCNRPKVILELGSGVSTYVLARLSEIYDVEKFHSVDNDASYQKTVKRQARDLSVFNFIDFVYAPLVDVRHDKKQLWYNPPTLEALGDKFDLVFVDGPQSDSKSLVRRDFFINVVVPRVPVGGAIILDDADRYEPNQMRNSIKDVCNVEFHEEYLPTDAGTIILRRE